MKNKNATGSFLISSFSLSIFLLSLIILSSGCKKIAVDSLSEEKSDVKNYQRTSPSLDPLLKQLVVWLKPGKKPAQLQKWIDSVQTAHGSVVVSEQCENCDKDNPLLLLSGPGIITYISGNTAAGGRTSASTPATGDDGPVYHSLNFPIVNIMPKQVLPDSIIPFPKNTVYTKGSVKVAVFDTGIDPLGLDKYPFISDFPSCIDGANVGWNFESHNKILLDNNHAMHGSTVSRFVAQQAVKYARNKVQILTVKTHGQTGTSDLFTILCGFAYAKERKVQMINASFGFYLPRLELYKKKFPVDPNVKLLRAFVDFYLTKNKILLIAAAGNKDDVNERATFILHGLPYPTEPRNLEKVSFYPASLARDPAFPNVIAVTTIDTLNSNVVSPAQNYSRYVVDIGVNADKLIPGTVADPTLHFVFINPRNYKNPTVEGSSFATPIVTGRLSAYYDLILPVLNKTSYVKSDILKALGAPLIRNDKDALFAKINLGRYMVK